jgi:hypothetical protein
VNRYFESLRPGDCSAIDSVPDHLFLVRVERVQHRWHERKPFYAAVFSVLEPEHLAGSRFSGHFYCTPKTLWKLNWFLRDFHYDGDLLSRGEINEQALNGLRGVLKVNYAVVRGLTFLNFDAFAPADQWNQLSSFAESDRSDAEVAS